MKKALAGLALGMLFSSAALADTSIDTSAFALTITDGPLPEDWNISLSGQSGNTYSISLDSLDNHLRLVEANDSWGGGAWEARSDWNMMSLDVHAGWRVTGLTISGVAEGVVAPGELPDFPPGRATNFANFHLTVWTPAMQSYGHQFDDMREEHALDGGLTGLDLTSPTDIGFSGAVYAEAWGIEGDGAFAGSLANAEIRDLVLHVQVAAIPEPGGYAMLLAGLGILAFAGKRTNAQLFH